MGSSPVVPTRDSKLPPVVHSSFPATTSVPAVRKLCERPGCSAIADVSYGMDHAALLVWIDDNARSERELAGRLCRRHADALVVPRGWTIDDRRDPIPRLFRTIAQEVSEGKTRPRRAAQPSDRATPPESPSLFEHDDGPPDVPDVVEATVSADVIEPETPPEADGVSSVSDADAGEISPEPADDTVDPGIVPELEYEPIDEMPPDDDVTDVDDGVIEETVIDDAGTPDDDVDPDATRAMPWTPQLTGRYSPDDTGPVSGRLLGRAFGVRKDEQ